MTNELNRQEQEANHYIEKHVLEPHQQVQSFGVQGLWQEVVLNYLKEKALVYVGQALRRLAAEKLVDLADWLLDQLQDYLLQQYQQATEAERRIFKEKMLEKFPQAPLTKRL